MATRDYRTELYESYASALRRTSESDSRRSFLVRLLRYLPDTNARILELGAGNGGFLRLLREQGFRNVTGVDGSVEQVELAGRAGVSVMLGDAVDVVASVPSATLDVVIALDVIEHFTKSEAFELLREISRVLVPGGRCIVHTVNAESPFFGAARYGDFTHEIAFTPGSMRQVLHAVGFSGVECYEDRPIVHGAMSLLRAILWHAVRSATVVVWAVETGSLAYSRILTRNFLTVAVK